MENHCPNNIEICVSDILKCTTAFLILIFINSSSLFGQIINPNIPSAVLDSLYESIQPLDNMFCHSNSDIIEKYHDTISEILFTKGKFNSLRMDGSQCVPNNQNYQLTFQNEAIQCSTIYNEYK